MRNPNERSAKRCPIARPEPGRSRSRLLPRPGETVLTLAGYSGAGYEHPVRTRRRVTRLLEEHDPATTIVNIGVTPEGIGRAYLWAKRRGFTTTGIVSSVVLSSGSPVSPACDHAFFVEDTVYGGYLDGSLSPTSEALRKSASASATIPEVEGNGKTARPGTGV